MCRYVAVILAFVFIVLPLARAQPCQTKPAKRAKAKGREAKAKAQLEKAKSLLNVGKRKEAIRRLRKITIRFPKTRAALEALDHAPVHAGRGGVTTLRYTEIPCL